MSRWNLAWLLGVTGAAVLGIAVSQSAPLRKKDKDYELVKLFVGVLDEVEQKYVRELDDDARRRLVEDMVNGGLERLDPHSGYINPKRYRQFAKDSKGKFGGVGIQVNTDRQSGELMVVSPLVGTPAYEAGVLAGDLIVKIDGKPTTTMTLNDAIELIQGDPGQKVTLSVLHRGGKEPIDIELTRAMIHVESVLGDRRKADKPDEWDYLIDKTDKIAYVRVNSFSETTADELRNVLQKLQNGDVHGLVIDLRNNPGGLLRSAVEICNTLIPDGRIVSTKGRYGQEETYDADGKSVLLQPATRYPICVLVNHYSASASEIVSAALQDHHRAVIVGERTYGKGSVQNVIRMEDGASALKLTTASYWRPSGHNIHRFPDSKETDEWGVKPDPGFEVSMEDEERAAYMRYRMERDVVLGKPGIIAPAPPSKGAKTSKTMAAKPPFEDRVLERAMKFLRQATKKAQAAAASLETRVG